MLRITDRQVLMVLNFFQAIGFVIKTGKHKYRFVEQARSYITAAINDKIQQQVDDTTMFIETMSTTAE
jgi:hypothetical protein